MRWFSGLSLCAAAVVAVGCAAPNTIEADKAQMNDDMVALQYKDAIDAAVIEQHTLYPYHFAGAKLNELGMRDATVLARHYRSHPGELNVRRGSARDDVYAARVQAVLDVLAASGVDVSRVTVEDDMPGGSGTDSSRVMIIKDRQPSSPRTMSQSQQSY